MKSALAAYLVLGLLLAGGVVYYLREQPARDTSVELPVSSATASTVAPTTELERGTDAPERVAVHEPAPSAPAPEPPAPSSEDASTQLSTEDIALLRQGTQPTIPRSVEDARQQYADLEVRYASMSPSELRQSFDALQRLLTQSEQTGEEKSAQLTVTQVEAIRREMTWIKERLYP